MPLLDRMPQAAMSEKKHLASMPHVMFLLPNLRSGGAERVIATLLRHIDRTRFRLNLLVIDMSGAVFRDDIPADVELIDLRGNRVLTALPKIVRIIWKRRPDVIFSTLSHLNLALAIIRPLLPRGLRLIVRESSIVSQQIATYTRPAWWAFAYRHFYAAVDLLVCQSRYMRDDLVNYFGYPLAKSVVINNPIDVQRVRQLAASAGPAALSQGAEHIELIAVGRLSWEKGFDLLIRSIALCRCPSVHLTIVGDGPLREELVQLASEAGVSGQVTFAGFQANPYPLLKRADFLVLSSRFEGFPNVVLEALACGVPVIATPAPGGTAEILRNVPGCEILNEISAESIAAALSAVSRGFRIPEDVVRPYEVIAIVKQFEEIFA
jgi:glycosyltransferase involved in cell wall biosynthesis